MPTSHNRTNAATIKSRTILPKSNKIFSHTKGEGDIRETIVKADVVKCVAGLPGPLFPNTQIPACIWFLTKTIPRQSRSRNSFRDRTDEVLFINARRLGDVVDRVLRAFTTENVEDDGVPLAEKMAKLTSELADEFAESARLETATRKDMTPFGFELPVGGSK